MVELECSLPDNRLQWNICTDFVYRITQLLISVWLLFEPAGLSPSSQLVEKTRLCFNQPRVISVYHIVGKVIYFGKLNQPVKKAL